VTPQAMQQIVNTVRSLSELQRVASMSAPRTIVMRGDQAQMALAQWLIAQLDQKSAPRGVQQFAPAVMPGDAARVFFLSNVSTAQALQDLVNQVRAVTNVQRVVSFPLLQAVALRAPVSQVTQSEQLIAAADQGK
jgi:hypothetical protein